MTEKKKNKEEGEKKNTLQFLNFHAPLGDMKTPPANLPHVVLATISRSRPLPSTRAL